MKIKLGIVGATGLAGQTLIELLEDDYFFSSGFSLDSLRLFASKSSAGKICTYKGSKVTIEETRMALLEQCDVLIFACDNGISQEFIPQLAKKNKLC
ncbi:MAG: hypothetical protein K2X39_03985, partial [Silvanigrellaceae bacterium]|nr:hypothetical protein [Silvanigrellaceae bacterium]